MPRKSWSNSATCSNVPPSENSPPAVFSIRIVSPFLARAKPALAAFRLPLVARRTGRGVALWGLVRPVRGATDVQVLFADPHQHFRTLAVVRTDAHGYWSRRTALRAGRRWRVRWTAPDGTLYTGPPIRAYR